MKDAEDEAFDELARKQGAWGGGFPAKRKMTMDKIHAEFYEKYVRYRTAFPKEYTAPQPAQEPHEYDWSMLEAAKESLREHMARIKELEAALKQALEALEHISKFGCNHVRGVCTCEYREAADAIKAALAQPAQEPVQRPWVGLTEKDRIKYGTSWEKDGERIDPMSVYKEQPEQEPVAWSYWQSCLNDDGTQTAPWVHRLSKFKPTESIINKDVTPLYTTPPQREWVGLTDEEIDEGNKQSWVTKQAWESAVWWASEKLKERNHGT